MTKLDNPVPYGGEQLVADQSFLRRLPVALIAKERLRFDAIVTASDISQQSFNSLRKIALEIKDDISELGNEGRAFALSQCWTLVDQLHAIRQLLIPPAKLAAKPGPFTKALLDSTKVASLLRNKMDHLSENLQNLSAQKGPRSPLYGSLSYFYSETYPLTGGSIVTIMSGALHGEDTLPCVNPLERSITLPVGQFTLTAFQLSIEFGHCLGTLREWLKVNEEKIEIDIRDQLRSQVANEDEIEKAMATLGGGLAVVAKIEFIADDETTGSR